MRVLCAAIVLVSMTCSLQAQIRGRADAGFIDSPRDMAIRRAYSTNTFGDPGGKQRPDFHPPRGETTFFDRFTIHLDTPENLFVSPTDGAKIDFVCEDYVLDRIHRGIKCIRLKVAKCGNIALTGSYAEADGERLVVTSAKDKEAVLYVLSNNRFGSPVERLRGRKVVVNLKEWSAVADEDEAAPLPLPTPAKSPPLLIQP